MAEKPILFNGEMVRAILDGRKTQTRRVIKPHNAARAKQDGYRQGCGLLFSETRDNTADRWYIKDYSVSTCWLSDRNYIKLCAPYKPGDILWVRETWNFGYIEISDEIGNNDSWFEPVDYRTRNAGGLIDVVSQFWYKADGDFEGEDVDMFWRPSIHMPREAARIFLKVTGVRVEMLQEISGKDCVAEGCDADMLTGVGEDFTRGVFNGIWDGTVQKDDLLRYGWDANPWVWVIEFERFGGEENGENRTDPAD